MPADDTIPGLPGAKGKDYDIVNFGGRIYVVYRTKLPNGKWITDAWRVSSDDYKALGINPNKVRHITKGQFQQLNVFGDIGEIARRGGGTERPLQTYLKQLREIYGPNVSWLNDKEYMETFIMGWMEGWDPGVIQQRLKRTQWYQSRTAAERSWELDMNKADRKSAVESMTTRVTEALSDLYGPTFNFSEMGVTATQIKKWAEQIASGQFGDPSEGFNIWIENQRNQAEKVEGSQAWIDRQAAAEEQRGFLNRPEDMYQRIVEDARRYLGPHGVPSEKTLQSWSERLVSERASDADWQQFLEKQAARLYPWLGPGEAWQDFADPYRRMAEDLWGQSVSWDDRILRDLGGIDTKGEPTGNAFTFNEFEQRLRKSQKFWEGPVAREEGFDLLNRMNELFQGVSV